MYRNEGAENERLRYKIFVMCIGTACLLTILAKLTEADKSFYHQKDRENQRGRDHPLQFVL